MEKYWLPENMKYYSFHILSIVMKLSNITERRKCLRQQMETFCDIAEHSGTKACRKFICSSAGRSMSTT